MDCCLNGETVRVCVCVRVCVYILSWERFVLNRHNIACKISAIQMAR